MAGNDPLVAEFNERDAAKAGVLWRDRVMCISDVRTSAGLIPTGATTPIIVNSGGANFIRWAAGVANAITVTLDIPGDYNEVIDKLHVRLKAFKSTGGDVGMVVTGAAAYMRDAAVAATAGSVSPTAAVPDTLSGIMDLNFSGSSFKGKDSITFTLTPDAHATAVVDLYGITVRYIGGTSLYNETDRYAS